jgi:hypothetical protein
MSEAIDEILRARHAVRGGSIFEEIVRLRREGQNGEALEVALWDHFGERVAEIHHLLEGFFANVEKVRDRAFAYVATPDPNDDSCRAVQENRWQVDNQDYKCA